MVEKRRRRKRSKKGAKKRSKKKRKRKSRKKKKSKKRKSKKRRKKKSKKRKSKKRKAKKRSGKKKKGGGALKLKVSGSKQKSKHCKAVFTKGGKKVATVHFGPNKKTKTHVDGCSSKDKAKYLKANKKFKKLKNCKHPGCLEYHLLYGDSNDLQKNLKHFKAKFKLA